MFHSLRFRLPALFFVGIVVAGGVAAAIALGLFQDLERKRSLVELRREARGIATLYQREGARAFRQDVQPRRFVAELERATGDSLFYVGVGIPGEESALTRGRRRLPDAVVDWRAARQQTFEFQPPKDDRTFLAVAHQVRFEGQPIGAVVVAKPKSELRERWLPLIRRLGLAFLVGILIAAGLAAYLSRRLTGPLAALAKAADQVAGGRYDVVVPRVRGRGEIGDLAQRFSEMAVRLREANELERNFLMTVSHELRTPLTAIRGHVAAVREGVAAEPAARELSLEAIALETGRLERLVGDILDLAKIESHRFTVRQEEIEMERLLDRAYSGFDKEARERGITYERRVSARPTIVSDGDRVLQIITNLLSNAFRWTPDGGRIGLELGAANGAVRVAVEDSGPGISPEESERIFRPFWSRDGRGTGLGLAISNELALALGGRIELDSTPGKGSRFELHLPVGAEPAGEH